MSKIFALSLTTEENTSDELWNCFANKRTGLKLTFEIESKIPDFREVYYSNVDAPRPIELLRDLFEKIKEKFNYIFNFSYISKIGAFYIKGCFKNEKEYRFLIKRDSDSYNAWNLKPIPFKDENRNDIFFIKLPFESKYAKFKLIKVEKGSNCNADDFNDLTSIVNANHKNVEIIR